MIKPAIFLASTLFLGTQLQQAAHFHGDYHHWYRIQLLLQSQDARKAILLQLVQPSPQKS